MSLQGQSGNKMHKKGVSIIELLIVIAITIGLGTTVLPLGASFLERNALRNKTNELASSLRVAQINSMSGKNGVSWGVFTDNDEITLYAGDSYATRNTSFDNTYTVPPNINIDPIDVNFSLVDGAPSFVGTVDLVASTDSKVVEINQLGVVNVF